MKVYRAGIPYWKWNNRYWVGGSSNVYLPTFGWSLSMYIAQGTSWMWWNLPKQTASSPLKIGTTIPSEISRVTSGQAFCNTIRRDCLQNDVFSLSELCPKNELALIQKVGTIQTGWARETQVHPTSSNINVLKMINHQITAKWLD